MLLNKTTIANRSQLILFVLKLKIVYAYSHVIYLNCTSPNAIIVDAACYCGC